MARVVRRDAAMKIGRSTEQPTERGADTSFTGVAWQQALAVGYGPEPLHVARVIFEPAARTVWHHHPHGQILVATSGVGRVQRQGGPVQALLPGDSVVIAPREVHWHGAAPDQLFITRPSRRPAPTASRPPGSNPSAKRSTAMRPTSAHLQGRPS